MFKILTMTATFALLTFTAYARSAPQLTEPQIVQVLMSINEGEIDSGQLAARQAQDETVKDFAQMMVEEHKENREAIKKIAKDQNLEPAESELSKSLTNHTKSANRALSENQKKNFDSTYMSQQIVMHEKALATIRDSLIPNAKNSELKNHLEKTQASVEEHLTHAKQLQSKVR